MRQYKANLNPLLSGGLGSKEGQVAILSAYQELRARFAEWVTAETQLASAKCRKSSTLKEIERLRSRSTERFPWALIAVVDFQSALKGSQASELAGAIFYHVAEWSDEIHDAPFSAPNEMARRDISEEISEASAELHLLVHEELSM
ncbi:MULTISPECIES: hypothetical protein [Streptomyces]|uniref:Uncharacterized protein n=1 Tax=Streptomyces ramulosus TaxID=47762 RepID=A0ABW1FNX2_9ACTN